MHEPLKDPGGSSNEVMNWPISRRPASATPVTRRRLSDPREAAREAAFAETFERSPSREQRLAVAWSYEAARPTGRQRLTTPADRLAARRAVDIVMSGLDEH